MLSLLANEFGAEIEVDWLIEAARWGHDAMIDHLVEAYGVDPNGAGKLGWTALHEAADRGRVRTVKHLVEKRNVDIHKRDGEGKTALDVAEEGMTECAAVLRGYGATNGRPVEEEEDLTESDDGWDSGEDSDADDDDDVM